MDSSDALPQYTPQAQQPYVVYEVHYDPTYQAPVLTFSMKDLPPCDSPLDLDVVYRYLVPDHFKSIVRSYGPAGAVSVRVGLLNHDGHSTTKNFAPNYCIASPYWILSHIFRSPLRH